MLLSEIGIIILRYRDSNMMVDTISSHNEIIQKEGYVWWGWWSRPYEKVAVDVFKNVDANTEMYLFDTQNYILRKVNCTEVVYDEIADLEIETPEIEKTPAYYSRNKNKMWFKLTKIHEPLADPNTYLRSFKYLNVESHFTEVRNGCAKYFGKRFNDCEELEAQPCTIWYLGRVSEEDEIKEKFLEITEDDVLAFKQKVLHSNMREECRPPLPFLNQNDKYIFISYSSKDYKSVYCDLIELYFRKIPYVYDNFLHTGEEWDNEVIQKIENKNCVGMLSFLSKNTFSSEAIMKEVATLLNKESFFHFCVNLEGRKLPSKILLEEIVHQFDNLDVAQKSKISAEQMTHYSMKIINYLNLFSDKKTFKSKKSEPDSSGHIDDLSKDIIEKLKR